MWNQFYEKEIKKKKIKDKEDVEEKDAMHGAHALGESTANFILYSKQWDINYDAFKLNEIQIWQCANVKRKWKGW